MERPLNSFMYNFMHLPYSNTANGWNMTRHINQIWNLPDPSWKAPIRIIFRHSEYDMTSQCPLIEAEAWEAQAEERGSTVSKTGSFCSLLNNGSCTVDVEAAVQSEMDAVSSLKQEQSLAQKLSNPVWLWQEFVNVPVCHSKANQAQHSAVIAKVIANVALIPTSSTRS